MARVLVRAVVVVLLALLVPVGPALADDEGQAPTSVQPDPDGDQNGGADRPGGEGGYDDGRDEDNGCGNDDDGEDDNRGHCLGVRDADPDDGHDDGDDGTDDHPEHDGDASTPTDARQPPPPTRAPATTADTPGTTAPASAATTPVNPAPPHPVRSRLARQNAEAPSRAATAAPLPQPLRLQAVGAEAGTVLAIPAPVADDDPGVLAIAGGMIATLFGLALATLVGGSLLLRRHPGRFTQD